MWCWRGKELAVVYAAKIYLPFAPQSTPFEAYIYIWSFLLFSVPTHWLPGSTSKGRSALVGDYQVFSCVWSFIVDTACLFLALWKALDHAFWSHYKKCCNSPRVYSSSCWVVPPTWGTNPGQRNKGDSPCFCWQQASHALCVACAQMKKKKKK